MHRPLLVCCLLASSLQPAACGSEDVARADGGVDAGPDADGDADTDADDDCDPVDFECPEVQPHPGGPCEGELDCLYRLSDLVTWQYTCVEGAWHGEYDGNFPPPLSEGCDGPFEGKIEGATVEVGPALVAEPFRPFEAEDEQRLVWGPQGAAMIEFRFRVEGDDVPECMLFRTVLGSKEGRSEPTVGRVRLRCSESLSVFAIVPIDDLGCREEPGTLDLDLEAELLGAGVTDAGIRVHYEAYEHPGGFRCD